MNFLTLVFAALGSGVAASYTGNINYFSPSAHHPSLGISIRKVAARHHLLSRDLPRTAWEADDVEFSHGVASGDPYADSVVLWTRVSPIGWKDDGVPGPPPPGTRQVYSHEAERLVNASKLPVCLDWKISPHKDLSSPADSGTVFTSSDIDWTVKVIASKLRPFTTYYYQFKLCDSDAKGDSEAKGPVGRTKTLPAKGNSSSSSGSGSSDVGNIKLAVYSCANYAQGFFNAYGNVANKDSVDYVVHLGDYMYEDRNGQDGGWGNALGRVPKPDKDLISLVDYRTRLAQYHADWSLRRSHEMFPWIAVWDDHEVADNLYKGGSAAMNNTEDSFVKKHGGVSVDQRKMNAVRAYFEWMPIRQVDMDDNLRIWRRFEFGDLFDLLMLDTRVYDRSITNLYWNSDYINKIKGEGSRSLMGPRQEAWFYRSLRESKAKWRVIGSQVVFSHTEVGPNAKVNLDAWDGYEANRNRTLETLYRGGIGNNILLAGDTHVSAVADVAWLDVKPYNKATGEGAIGVEFAGPAVTSPSSSVGQNGTLAAANAAARRLEGMNRPLQWQESYFRGYFELDIGRDEVKAQYFGMANIRTNNSLEISLANFTVKSGENRLSRGANGKVGGGRVEAGSLKGGEMVATNLTHNTQTGEWKIF